MLSVMHDGFGVCCLQNGSPRPGNARDALTMGPHPISLLSMAATFRASMTLYCPFLGQSLFLPVQAGLSLVGVGAQEQYLSST